MKEGDAFYMNYYIEILISFKLSLEKIGSWWSRQIEKSLKKINDNSLQEGAKHMLQAYGGMGSVSDESYFDNSYYKYNLDENQKMELEAIYEILTELCYLTSKHVINNLELNKEYIDTYYKEKKEKLENSIIDNTKVYEYQQKIGYQYCHLTLNKIILLQKELEVLPRLKELLLNKELTNYLNDIPKVEKELKNERTIR